MSTDPCPFCSKKFVSVDFLAQHVERRHPHESAEEAYNGPGGGIDQDSEGEIRTSRLERQRALWSPQTDLEREMSGARGPASIRSNMRIQRARENSPGFWPVVVDTTARNGKLKIEEAIRQGTERLEPMYDRRSVANDGRSGQRRLVKPNHARHTESRLTWPSTSDQVSTPVEASFHSRFPPPPPLVMTPKVPSSAISAPPRDAIEGTGTGRSDHTPSQQTFATCPLEECGEQVLSIDIDDHIERHQAEQLVLESDDTSSRVIAEDLALTTQPSHSLINISTHQSTHDLRSDPLPQVVLQPPPYDSSAAATHSYYAPEKPERPSETLVMGQSNQIRGFPVTQNNNVALSQSRSAPMSPLAGPSTGHSSSDNKDRSSIPTAIRTQAMSHVPQHPHARMEQSDPDLLQSVPVTSAAVSSQERPKSAMAVLSHPLTATEPASNSGGKHQVDSGSIDAFPSATQQTTRRVKRQSQFGSAMNEVKDRVTSWTLTSTVDGLERKLRASREKHEATQLKKEQLGPYALEQEMPAWLYKQLQRGPRIEYYRSRGRDGKVYVEELVENETPGIVPMLAHLSELDSTIARAYYCHPATQHVSKIRSEGGFCGYRNIQMQVSYLQGAKADGHDVFPGRRLPGVLQLQDSIEAAWDAGFYSASRREIGRLRGTRKWIGSVEAHALFQSLHIGCDAYTYINNPVEGRLAHDDLFVAIEAYFRDHDARSAPSRERVSRTLAPPIFLQHPGHSLTVVGYEVHTNGQRNLVVLDPMYVTSRAMDQLLDAGIRRVRKSKPEILQIYRRHEGEFQKYGSFETLNFASPAPNIGAWDVRYPILRPLK